MFLFLLLFLGFFIGGRRRAKSFRGFHCGDGNASTKRATGTANGGVERLGIGMEYKRVMDELGSDEESLGFHGYGRLIEEDVLSFLDRKKLICHVREREFGKYLFIHLISIH